MYMVPNVSVISNESPYLNEGDTQILVKRLLRFTLKYLQLYSQIRE